MPGAIPMCLKDTLAQPTVLWQLSQDIDVGTCSPGLPCMVMLLWHFAQVPGITPLWVKKAGFQLVVRWQLLQLTEVGKWFVGLNVETTRPPGEWHCIHCVGVPRKIP